MARGPNSAAGVGAIVIAALVVAAAATPASGQAQVATRTFKPVDTTRRALVFAPKAVPADAVRAARVRLRNRPTDASRVRGVPVAKVRRAVERRSRLRIKKPPRVGGSLELTVGRNGTGVEDSPEPPPPAGAPGTIPSAWEHFTSFESDLNSGTDFGWRIDSPFSVTRTDEVGGSDGAFAAKIVTNGGSQGCSCPRMTFEDGFSYGPGDEVWISGSWRIPDPTRVAWSRLMNLGHWTAGDPGNWYLALESTAAGTMQVSYSAYGDPKYVVLPARPIPANRWFRVDLHFKLSPTDGRALTEWFIDGELVGQSTSANMLHPSPLHFYNAGLSYFWPGNGNTTVYFDAPRLTA